MINVEYTGRALATPISWIRRWECRVNLRVGLAIVTRGIFFAVAPSYLIFKGGRWGVCLDGFVFGL